MFLAETPRLGRFHTERTWSRLARERRSTSASPREHPPATVGQDRGTGEVTVRRPLLQGSELLRGEVQETSGSIQQCGGHDALP